MEYSSIVGTDLWAEFLVCRNEKRVVARPHAALDYFRSLWSGWEFDAICRFTPLVESPTFRMITRGKQIPEAAYRGRESSARLSIVRQLWESGASINFSRVELFSNPVLALVRSLEGALQCPTRVHYFATPAHSQALGPHSDHDDALVIQLEGEKTWLVYPESDTWPDDPTKAANLLRENPPDVVTLKPGGWLYLPKGIYHEVRNAGEAPSKHFTLGLHSLSWGYLLERALALAREEAPALREKVGVSQAGELIRNRLEEQLFVLRPFVTRAFEAEHYGQMLAQEELTPRATLDAADLGTRFCWRRNLEGVVTKAAGLEIMPPYRSVPLVLRAELAATLAVMKRGVAFVPTELPLAPEIALTLCRFLANVGVLLIEDVA